MIRNIDLLRANGIMVKGNWFNKHVLMLNETIHSTQFNSIQDPDSPKKDKTPKKKGPNDSDNDSIFNIELSEMPNKIDS